MSFLGKAILVQVDTPYFSNIVMLKKRDMLNVNHSPAHLCCAFHFRASYQLQQRPVPLWFPLPAVDVATDATPTHWAFYCQGAQLLLSILDTWSGSMCSVYIVLQRLQAVAPVLHQMAFHFTDKVVALHLDKSTAKAYICNQDGTVSLFLSKLACCILHLADMQGITLIPVYIHTHLGVEADWISWWKLVQEWYLFPHIACTAFWLWSQPEVDLLASSNTNQCHLYYTPENQLILGALGLTAFHHPWQFQGSYISSSTINSCGSVHISSRTCHEFSW